MSRSSPDELVFLPLGGSNEIGMNFNLYGYGPAHARQWIVVDLGITFGDQTTPGVEINKIFRLVRDDVMEATANSALKCPICSPARSTR